VTTPEEHPTTIYRFDAFQLDVVRGTLRGPDNAELALRPKAFALLQHLVEHPGRLHRRNELLETLWPDVVVTDDSLTQCVSDLRRVFGDRASHVLRTLPRRGYVLTAEVQRDAPARSPRPAGSTDGRTTLLVLLPFEHPDGDRAGGFASLLTSDLAFELARFEGLRIRVAPHGETSGGFCVRGEVRTLGSSLRITVRLEDAASGATFWAERFDRAHPVSAGVPDGLIDTVAVSLGRQVDRESLRLARPKPPSALTVRELCLLGREHHHRGTEADTFVALAIFERAIAADPDYALAYAWQAYTVHRVITHGWGPLSGRWPATVLSASPGVRFSLSRIRHFASPGSLSHLCCISVGMRR
jgi:adenylate cyclase